jgi:NAD(P)-dependent dehydrogenase (short-subunit alcohol dehydrogenase family)
MNQPRVAVVTGASSGIGKETARALLALGWQVIGTGRDPARSAAAEAELRAGGGRIDFLRGDMALMAETQRIASAIKGLTGRVDLLFNNAGGVRDARYPTSEGGEETFTANHLAPFCCARRPG